VLPHPSHKPEDESDEQDEEQPEVNGRLCADRSREVRGAHDVRDRDTPVRVTDATVCARSTRALSNGWFASWSRRSL